MGLFLGSDSGLESGDNWELERICDHKLVRKAYRYLVKWKGFGDHHNVWKTGHQLRHAPKLVEEYWDRKGGRPADAEGPAPDGGKGPKPTKAPKHAGATRTRRAASSPSAPNVLESRSGRASRSSTPSPRSSSPPAVSATHSSLAHCWTPSDTAIVSPPYRSTRRCARRSPSSNGATPASHRPRAP